VSVPADRARTAASVGVALMRSTLHPEQRRAPDGPSLAPEELARIAIRWPARYGWDQAAVWVDRLRGELARVVRLTRVDIPQPHEGTLLIEVDLDDERHRVAIDYSDYERVLDEVASASGLVFKMQYRQTGYGTDRIVPGGYVPSRRYLRALLPGLRHLREHSTARYAVYGRFGSTYAPGVRGAAVRALSEQHAFEYEGALALRPYPDYLKEAALSQICIDLPGNGEFCHRLVEYLALGCCVVRPPTGVLLPVALRDGVEIVFADDHEQGLVRACAELLTQPERIQRIGRAARAYYDAHLREDQLALYYLRSCLRTLPGDRLTRHAA
jgi:glycosyl transferase family 1